jgi:uncharacterized protein YdaU (DUF1376 family)
MNYLELYPGDYLRDTGELSLVEHGAYLRLLLHYYSTELPLPAAAKTLARICGALEADERQAVVAVADRYFPIGADGLRHNARADDEIAKARERIAREPARKANQVERQARARARRHDLFDQLRGFGQVPAWDASTSELEHLLAACHAPGHAPVTRDVTPPVTEPVTPLLTATTRHTPHEKLEALPPAPNNPSSGDLVALPTPTEAGRACRLMRDAGVAQANPSHPNLLAALAEGITPETLADYARQAIAARKQHPFSYAIAAARGDRANLSTPPGGTTHGTDQRSAGGSRLSAVERVTANIERARRERGEPDPLEGTATPVPRRDPVG